MLLVCPEISLPVLCYVDPACNRHYRENGGKMCQIKVAAEMLLFITLWKGAFIAASNLTIFTSEALSKAGVEVTGIFSRVINDIERNRLSWGEERKSDINIAHSLHQQLLWNMHQTAVCHILLLFADLPIWKQHPHSGSRSLWLH